MSLEDRLQKLRQRLIEKELDAIFISQPENRRYLSGFAGSAGYLLITSQHKILATDFRYLEQAKRQAPGYEIYSVNGDLGDWFPNLVAGLNLKKLGLEAGHVTVSFLGQLSEILSKAGLKLKLIPVKGMVEALRAIKEPEEIEFLTQAGAIGDAAFEYARDTIHPGMSEQEAAWEIEKFTRERGSEAAPFEIIIASGPNSALPHAKPSSRTISTGEPIVIDIGVKIGGYSSDLSRTISLGTPDKIFNKIYDIVLGAQLTAIAMITEGMSGEEADKMARIVIRETGYSEAFGHALGHGIGLAPHESPRLGPHSAEPLVNGMVFTIEPGIYINGWGGVRIEDMVTMEDGKIRVISKSAK